MSGEDRCANRTGVNRVDPDVVAPELQCRGLGQAPHCPLAGHVRGEPERGRKPGARGDIATAENAAKLLEPLRDLFAAVFFVVFGLNTDPATIPPVLGWAILLAVVTSITKIATGWWAARRQGIRRLGRARAGAALVARGEFSIVIAGLAVAYAAVPAELAALATAYVLLMAVIGPIAARVVEPVARWTGDRMTRAVPAAQA